MVAHLLPRDPRDSRSDWNALGFRSPITKTAPASAGVFVTEATPPFAEERTGLSSLIAAENEPVDVAQIAMALGIIHAVADDEIFGNIETDIADRQIQRGRRRFAQ